MPPVSAKYVVIDNFPHVFSPGVDHKHYSKLGKITSAGFVNFPIVNGDVRANCYGNSKSLNLGPGPEDEKLINFWILGRI